jgi:hypothetical protein
MNGASPGLGCASGYWCIDQSWSVLGVLLKSDRLLSPAKYRDPPPLMEKALESLFSRDRYDLQQRDPSAGSKLSRNRPTKGATRAASRRACERSIPKQAEQ